MSKRTKLLLVACCIVFFAGGIFTYFNFFAGNPNKGSIVKDTITTKCNGKDVVCVQKDGKIIAQKKGAEKKPCEKTKNCYLNYAANERAAVSAIREYTGVKDMNLMPFVKDGTPDNVTYYCNGSNHCWAVDHTTHKVIEIKAE